MIRLRHLTKFFPYESVHAVDACIQLEDKNGEWYDAISKFLAKYEPTMYVGCSQGYFNLKMDNKITLEMEDVNSVPIYLTYWDNTIFISNNYNGMGNTIKSCFVTRKK